MSSLLLLSAFVALALGQNNARPSTTSRTNAGLPNVSVTRTSTSSNGDATSTTAAGGGGGGGGLPKLPKPYTIPTVTPPPNANAPFMQQSKYPEGTIFIAVGSGLALCLLIVIAWRGIVAWSLHRSISRATVQPGVIDSKSMLHKSSKGGNGSGGFYAAGPGSALSLDHLGSSRSPVGPNGSLFFSPTSPSVAPNSASGDRRSTYLPAGFYASGNSNSAVLSNNSQTRFSKSRGPGISPPGTPLMAPQSRGGASSIHTERMSGIRINDSQTSLALPPTGRAPSAYLEDLFENHQLPELGGPGRL